MSSGTCGSDTFFKLPAAAASSLLLFAILE